MKVSEAVQFYLQYKKANAKGNSLKNYSYILQKFEDSFGEREIDTITTEEIFSFLTALTRHNKQNTKRSSYSTLKTFFNFISYTIMPDLKNPCDSRQQKNCSTIQSPINGLSLTRTSLMRPSSGQQISATD